MAKTFQKLTRTEIRKAAAPGSKINEHGITFERLANGDGLYSVNVMVDGQRIHRVIGRESEGTTRTQAEDFISKVRNDARHDRLALPKGRKVALSLKDAASKYLERLEVGDGKDISSKRMRLKLHLIPILGAIPLNKLSTFDIERYKKQRQQETSLLRPRGKEVKRQRPATKITAGTINRELACLSHLLNKAEEWGWVDRVPCKIRRLKEQPGRIVYLTIQQASALVEHAKRDGNTQIYPFVVIALETSMRKGEILSIRREHVDLARQTIFIPKAKAGAREQPITKHLSSFLEAHIAALPDGMPWLFPSPGAASGHATDVRKAFRRVVVAAGLDPNQVVRHTLRHTAITHLVQAGVDLPTVKRISGHKTLIMVERYAHANGAHIQAAMDKLDARYRAA